MLFRCLKAAVPGLDTSTSGVPTFVDEASIASWAINEVRFAFKNNIMNGVAPLTIAPLGSTTREQGIVLVKRTYEAYEP